MDHEVTAARRSGSRPRMNLDPSSWYHELIRQPGPSARVRVRRSPFRSRRTPPRRWKEPLGMKRPVTLSINGTEHAVQVEPRALLVHVLRDDLNLTGTHVGCDTSQCGACTVLMDGRAVKSCTVLALQAE